MGKLILFLLIIGIIYFIFFKKPKNNINENIKKFEEDNDLIMCDKCKTFYPKDEIMKIDGKNICKDCYANT